YCLLSLSPAPFRIFLLGPSTTGFIYGLSVTSIGQPSTQNNALNCTKILYHFIFRNALARKAAILSSVMFAPGLYVPVTKPGSGSFANHILWSTRYWTYLKLESVDGTSLGNQGSGVNGNFSGLSPSLVCLALVSNAAISPLVKY